MKNLIKNNSTLLTIAFAIIALFKNLKSYIQDVSNDPSGKGNGLEGYISNIIWSQQHFTTNKTR
jgi:hypothetical protein